MSFEESTEPITPDDQLEDVTEEIFGALSGLERCQMLCRPDLELFDTMSCFEVLDRKMDSRMHRAEALTPAKARQSGVLIQATDMSDS